METHPHNAPLTYVTPTADMQIKVSMYVDHNGKIYLPYLHDWRSVCKFNLSAIDFCMNIWSLIPSFVNNPAVFGSTRSYSSDDCHIRRISAGLFKTKGEQYAISSSV